MSGWEEKLGWVKMIAHLTQRAGFEPTRGNPIGFQVQRLNHSAIVTRLKVFMHACVVDFSLFVKLIFKIDFCHYSVAERF